MWLMKRLTIGACVLSPAIALAAGVAGMRGEAEALQAGFVVAQATEEVPADAAAAEPPADAEEEPAVFTEEYLQDAAHIEAGGATWANICRGCHGAAAYPGKAPKLRPRRYTPDFVYDRVTNGYKGMPSWKEVLTKDERMEVVSYVLSREFDP